MLEMDSHQTGLKNGGCFIAIPCELYYAMYFRSRLGGSPCHHSMARPWVADGTASSWRLAVNILNKQPWTNDKGWSSSLGVGRGANNPSP
jgi:hypothetical protein